ncbi:MAG: hypothetical protein PF495_13985 [Spirochaetales bacterium]|jgi:branched-chain amino acid transport system permease protein|nr:hypothetical protein [Spirochaetales bacterium]
MVTVGLSFFFRGTIELIWGTDTRVFNPPVFSIEPITIGMISISEVYLWSFVAAIILLVIFVCFFKYTRWGLAMQATADDEMAALSVGVSARFVYAAAWAIAFMAAGVAGTLLGNINGLNISVGYLWCWAGLIPYQAPLSEVLPLEYCRILPVSIWTDSFRAL